MIRKILSSLLVISGLAWSLVAFAEVPALLTQQGRLFDSAGTPKTGTVSITFNVYAAATGGTALWTETDSVTLDQGYFSVQLGAKTILPPTIWDGSTRYLGVTVGTDAEMTPREPITSVPYAIQAGTAARAVVADSATTAGSVTGAIPAAQIAGTLTAAQLPASIPATQISGALSAAQLPASIPGSSITGAIDGALVSKVAAATTADTCASATSATNATNAANAAGGLATTITNIQNQVTSLGQGHTVVLDGSACVPYTQTGPYSYLQDGLIHPWVSNGTSMDIACPLPMRIKASTVISNLTAIVALADTMTCTVLTLSLSSLSPATGYGYSESSAFSVTGGGSSALPAGVAGSYHQILPLGGPYTSSSYPKAIRCTMPNNSYIRAITWTETD